MASLLRPYVHNARLTLHAGLALLAACAADTGFAPGREGGTESTLGAVSIALTGVPDRVRCVRLEVSGNGTSSTSAVAVAENQRDVTVSIGPLAFGSYTLTAYAYDATCATTPTPSWRSNPTSLVVNVNSAAHDDLTLRPYTRTEVELDFKPYIDAVALSNNAGLVLTSDSRVMTFGRATYADGLLLSLGNSSHVFAAQDLYCTTLTGTGGLACTGSDGEGSLGNGAAGGATTPVVIAGLTNVLAMDANSQTTCAVTALGQLSCWGDNADGQIVAGITTDQVSPVTVVASYVRDVAVGYYHICYVTHEGSLSCRGSNASGQLGELRGGGYPLGSNILPNAIQVAAGGNSTYALLADGTVVAWGANASGQLGNGSVAFTATPTPQRVGSLEEVVEIAAEYDSACARTRSGEVWCWGSGAGGALGNGRPDIQSTPVLTTTGAASLTDGVDNYCVTTTTNDLMCWGRGYDGLFGGPADTTHRTLWVPTPVAAW